MEREQEIQHIAYQLWQEEGQPEGRAIDHWLKAVQMLEQREVKDPMCGMSLDEKKAPAKAEYQGKAFYFCSPHCKTAFEKDPGRYVN